MARYGRLTEPCPGSGQRWKAGPEGGLDKAGKRRRPDRAECPSCGKSWRSLGRRVQPLVDSPHHTVPLHPWTIRALVGP